MGPISNLSCLYLATPDLQASVRFYTSCFGMEVGGTESNAVALGGAASSFRQLVLCAGQHAGLLGLEFAVHSESSLSTLAESLGNARDPFIADGLPFPVGSAFAVLDPHGIPVRVCVAEHRSGSVTVRNGDRPSYLSHVVLNTPSPTASIDFYVNDLGLTVSDAYERDLLTFLRADQPQHHCVGLQPGRRSGLNHFAFDCGCVDAVMKSVGRMRQAGYEPIWGPGRHGPGGNVFCYYADPVGCVAEFTCDLIQVTDESSWTPSVWARTPENGNVWGTGTPSRNAIDLMSGDAQA
jgi:catechol 2,3-dioxygenase-like lactoylglutathione lyase family enzyme